MDFVVIIISATSALIAIIALLTSLFMNRWHMKQAFFHQYHENILKPLAQFVSFIMVFNDLIKKRPKNIPVLTTKEKANIELPLVCGFETEYAYGYALKNNALKEFSDIKSENAEYSCFAHRFFIFEDYYIKYRMTKQKDPTITDDDFLRIARAFLDLAYRSTEKLYRAKCFSKMRIQPDFGECSIAASKFKQIASLNKDDKKYGHIKVK